MKFTDNLNDWVIEPVWIRLLCGKEANPLMETNVNGLKHFMD